MKFTIKTAAAALAVASFVATYAHAEGAAAAAKKHHAVKKEAAPSVEEQIQALRNELQGQINSLKNQLSEKDQQLQQAQQSAAEAQQAAAKAQQAADAQQTVINENASAVDKLKSNVNEMKQANADVVSSVTQQTAEIKKAIASPDAIQYKGITISPAGSFIAAETVYRNHAIGDGLNTHFTAVPLNHSNGAQISEWQGSGRQSRIALKATGKAGNMTLTGYYEMDWLSAGATSNNNQSNSYTVRQRQLWADARLDNGWDFSGGQGWSLAAETTQGLRRGTEILPASIDPQYVAGFVWTRQYSFRVTKDFGKKFFAGVSAENAEMLDPAGSNLPSNLLYGASGDGGGLYNGGAHYSFNVAPDFVAKIAMEPGWGHWELFGVGRFFRDRVFPNASTGSSMGAWNDVTVAGGIGGGFRGPLANKKITVGLKGLWGQGVGRYGSSTIADVTLRPDGQISPLRTFSALSTVELNPTNRLNIYFNYGGDYAGRDFVTSGGKQIGYGTYAADMSGCNTEPVGGALSPNGPAHCTNQNKDVQETTIGYWYNFYSGAKGRLRQGIQYSHFQRDLWSGMGGTTNPGGGARGTDDEIYTSFRYYLP